MIIASMNLNIIQLFINNMGQFLKLLSKVQHVIAKCYYFCFFEKPSVKIRDHWWSFNCFICNCNPNFNSYNNFGLVVAWASAFSYCEPAAVRTPNLPDLLRYSASITLPHYQPHLWILYIRLMTQHSLCPSVVEFPSVKKSKVTLLSLLMRAAELDALSLWSLLILYSGRQDRVLWDVEPDSAKLVLSAFAQPWCMLTMNTLYILFDQLSKIVKDIWN